jgi:hypothetical protein
MAADWTKVAGDWNRDGIIRCYENSNNFSSIREESGWVRHFNN